MRRRVPIVVAAISAAAFAFGPAWGAGGGTDLKLLPSGFGPHTYASWKAQQGEADLTQADDASQGLYFQKFVTTSTYAAAVARVKGIAGQPFATLQLAWDHRNDGHCGAGAPRWVITTTDSSHNNYLYALGCDAAAHSPAPEDPTNWTHDQFQTPSSQSPDPSSETITGLAIVFDEGTDQGNGFIYLDNIQVNEKIWQSAADNGAGS